MATRKSSIKKPVEPTNPFTPSVLVAKGLDPLAVAKALAGVPQPEVARFPDHKRGGSNAAEDIAVFDAETGEVRGLRCGVDYVVDRAGLAPASGEQIPGAELFDIDTVEGRRVVRPVQPTSHAGLGTAVSRFISWTGAIPDPRRHADVQSVWNLVPGSRSGATPGGEVR